MANGQSVHHHLIWYVLRVPLFGKIDLQQYRAAHYTSTISEMRPHWSMKEAPTLQDDDGTLFLNADDHLCMDGKEVQRGHWEVW